MAWLAVNKDGTELISPFLPNRDLEDLVWDCFRENAAGWYDNYGIELPKGTIQKIIGRELTWDDKPVKIE